jgi:pimeloyl-ACP methyl ester carboxylesterase
MDGGMVGPRAFAVFTLMTNSNFVGGFPGTRQNDSVHTVPRVHLGNVGRGEIAMRMTSMLLAAIAAMVATATFAQTPKIVMEEMMVPSGDPGIEIYVRNKRPADLSVFRPERTLLYVHGATYPSSTAFDLQLDGMSWMDYFAARGYDVYLLDLRGYGKSTRPKEMSEKPEVNAPIVRGDTAVKDISAVVDFILKRRNIAKLDLLGWSWGTTLMATYTTLNPDKVERLVLYGPAWIRTTPSLVQTAPGPTPAYRMVSKEQALGRWLTGVPEDKKATLIPAGWFDSWAAATWAGDPIGAAMSPPVLRAPNGVVQDGMEFFGAGKAYYDPAKITVPTLLVGAEWDRDTPPYMAQTLFPLLVNSPGKRYVLLAEGTHTIIMERNRLELFKAVQAFLDEARRS